jgi:cation diffusion facilitator CzcD-associated flavoprotein CzcO
VGGLWKYTPETSGDGLFAVPQSNPRIGLERPVWRDHQKPMETTDHGQYRRDSTFLSPIYEHLETNIPKSLMAFSEKPFSEDVQLFPSHDSVQDYLEEYSKDVRALVQTGTQVVDIKLLDSNAQESEVLEERWSVETVHLDSGRTSKNTYNAIVVASGHYSAPHIPDIPGARDWNRRYPGSISHSKYYRAPESFVCNPG